MTKFIPISIIVLYALVVISCTRSLNNQEDFNEDFNQIQQENLTVQTKRSDSTSSNNTEPDPDVPIKDTHDWKKAIEIKNLK